MPSLHKYTQFQGSRLQTNNTLFLANNTFAKAKQDKLKFQAKNQEALKINNLIKFNGGLIILTNNSVFFNQERQCKNLRTVDYKQVDVTSFRGVARKAVTPKDQYIA